MVICKRCGRESLYIGKPCSYCNQIFTFDETDIENRLAILEDAKANKQYEEVVECYHILADTGILEYEIEFARVLERGQLVDKNLDMAMEYYYRGAVKNHPYCAYKYSRLAARMNDSIGRFWLAYSAILGCEAAYPELAEELSLQGREEEAHYYYSLAAACDDVSSIVTLAKRFHTGIGVPKSDGHAKWYLSKLKIPPIYAIKLAYQLRLAKAEEPPIPTLKNYDGLLKNLALTAEQNGFRSAFFKLNEILSQRGDNEASVILGDLLVRGDGCERNLSDGLVLLTQAAAHKNTKAYLYLARLYLFDKDEKNTSLGIDYCMHAGELGSAEALLLAGDAFANEYDSIYNIPMAINCYEAAGMLGSLAASEKATALNAKRASLYDSAKLLEAQNPKDSHRLYRESADMGYSPAMIRLAELSGLGIGCKKSRKDAFLWYNAAADCRDSKAFYPLGICYSIGFGVQVDFKKALNYLMEAEANGEERAHAKIISIYDRKLKKTGRRLYSTAMRLIHMQKFDAAYKFLDVSAEIKNPKALYTLGCFYEFGIATPTNKAKAYELYEEAYRLEFRDPRSVYKLAILKAVKNAMRNSGGKQSF